MMTLARVARSLRDDQFTASAWVSCPPVRPGGLSALPPGSRTDLVGALPKYDDEWTWLAVPDEIDSGVSVFPVWAESSLWHPETSFHHARSDMDRVCMGVWYQVQEYLEISNLGLVEVLLGSVHPAVVESRLDDVAEMLSYVASLDDEAVLTCPRTVLGALQWLNA